MTRTRAIGAAAVVLAVAFNIPFSVLAKIFAYPAILRQPAGEVLAQFHQGGAPLVLTWLAFMLTALVLVPFAIAFANARFGDGQVSMLAVGAAMTGALAGLAQAIGLSRWVFVVPAIARQHADPAATEVARVQAERTFEMLNLWGGVAIGEHIGQVLTCMWIAFMLTATWHSRHRVDRIATAFGLAAIAAIAIGLGDGISIALGNPVRLFRFATVAGYLALTGWLIASGIALWTEARPGH